MVVADDFLSPAFALALALGPALDELLEELLTTVSCPEISENNNKEQVCSEPISMTVHVRDTVVAWMNTYTAGKCGKE